jgi:hypothetical protein
MNPYVFSMHCEVLKDILEPHYDDPLSINRMPNGCIDHTVRISITLRYLAGGKAMDIALVHGVSHAKVLKLSGWLLMPSINILNYQSIFQHHMTNNCNLLMTFVVKVRLDSQGVWVQSTLDSQTIQMRYETN